MGEGKECQWEDVVNWKEEGAFADFSVNYMHHKRADSQTIAVIADALSYFTA